MNKRSYLKILLWASALFVATAPTALAQAGRIAGQHADDAFRLLPVLFGIFSGLGGVVAVLSAGVYARNKKTDSATNKAMIVAAVGGVWTANAWFGWPFVTVSRAGFDLLGIAPTEASEFSFLRLIGVGIFAIIGVAICAGIAESKETDCK